MCINLFTKERRKAMYKVKKFFAILILFIFAIVSMCTMTYATSVKVTDENLKSSIEGFVSSNDNDKNYKITVANNQINI